MTKEKQYYETYEARHVLMILAICICYKIRYIAEYVDDYSVKFTFLVNNEEEASTAVTFLGTKIIKTV